MSNFQIAKLGLCLLACSVCGLAQSAETSSQQPSTGEGQAPYRQIRVSHPRILCWKQAGIAPAMVNERWQIEERGKGKITAACTDPTLSASQRADKIQKINADTDEEVASLIPSKQLQAFKACQAEADKSQPKPAKDLGPCGNIIVPPPAKGEHDHMH